PHPPSSPASAPSTRLLTLSALTRPPNIPSFPTRRSSDLRSKQTALRPPTKENRPRRPAGGLPVGFFRGSSSLHTFIADGPELVRSEEHTSELQSPDHLVFRLLLEKKNEIAYAIPVVSIGR